MQAMYVQLVTVSAYV